MIVVIDFSVFIKEAGAFGNVTGELDMPVVPQIGDSLSFLFPGSKSELDLSVGFEGILKVTDRVIPVNQSDQPLSLALSEVVVLTKGDAIKVMQHFESAFGLFAISYLE